jgi:hypothetical protein
MRIRSIQYPAIAFALLLSGCHTPGFTGTAGFKSMIRTEICFGRAVASGGEVGDADWAEFVRREVAPRFPDGFTELDARTRRRTESGEVVAERSTIVVIIHEASPNARMHLYNIIGAYKRHFRQDAVFRVVDQVGVTF